MAKSLLGRAKSFALPIALLGMSIFSWTLRKVAQDAQSVYLQSARYLQSEYVQADEKVRGYFITISENFRSVSDSSWTIANAFLLAVFIATVAYVASGSNPKLLRILTAGTVSLTLLWPLFFGKLD
jgi:hypothetical protein